MIPLPPSGSLAALYERFSIDLQNESSLEYQDANCRKLCERFGWPVTHVFPDAARSGTTLTGRFGLMDAIAAARRGAFQVLVIDAQDRLSRNQADTFALLETFAELGVTVVSARIGGVIDPVQATFASLQAAQEVESIKNRSRSGQQQAVRSGRISGSVGYGYRIVRTAEHPRGLREIDPVTGPILKRILTEYRAGMSPAAICAGLNRDGIPSPHAHFRRKKLSTKAQLWKPAILIGSATTGSGILRNTMPKGEFAWGRTTRKRRRDGTMLTSAGLVSDLVTTKVEHLRIISDADWDAIQGRLEANSLAHPAQKSMRGLKRPVYLLSGLVHCGVCGASCVVTNGRFACSGRDRAGTDCWNSRRTAREDVERALLAGFSDHLLNPALLAPFAQAYEEERRARHARREADGLRDAQALAGARLRKAQLEEALGMATTGGQGMRSVLEQLDRVGGEIQRLERAVRATATEVDEAPDLNTLTGMLKAMLPNLADTFAGEGAEVARARELVRLMVSRVVITPLPVEREDGRGSGPVSITVDGELTRALQLADVQVGRVTLSGSSKGTWLRNAILDFRFTVDIPFIDKRLVGGVYDDAPLVARALRLTDRPVRNRDLEQLLLTEDETRATPAQTARLDIRVRRAIEHLAKAGLLRRVPMGREVGYVPSSSQLTDEQWLQRDAEPACASAVFEVEMVLADPVIIALGRHAREPADQGRSIDLQS